MQLCRRRLHDKGPFLAQEQPSAPQVQRRLSKHSHIVKLNVGGRRFTTTQSTLQAYPDTFFARMFATALQPAHLDEEGHFFIDRDGQLFEYVLCFLRDRELAHLPKSVEELEALQREANFYGLSELQERVEQQIPLAQKKQRLVSFELSVWGVHTTCRLQHEGCNCGLPCTLGRALSEQEGGDGRPPVRVPAPQFEERPNLILEFLWDPQAEEAAKSEICRHFEAQIRSALTPLKDSGNDLNLHGFLAGVDERVQSKVEVIQAFPFSEWISLINEDTSHYDMWVRLQLRRRSSERSGDR